MSWIFFSHFASGVKGYEFFDDESKARELMEDELHYYKKRSVVVEFGIAEVVETVKVN